MVSTQIRAHHCGLLQVYSNHCGPNRGVMSQLKFYCIVYSIAHRTCNHNHKALTSYPAIRLKLDLDFFCAAVCTSVTGTIEGDRQHTVPTSTGIQQWTQLATIDQCPKKNFESTCHSNTHTCKFKRVFRRPITNILQLH